MHQILKKIQEDMAVLKSEMADLKHGQIRLREDVHHFAGDLLRFERTQADIQVRIERIGTRLNINDA